MSVVWSAQGPILCMLREAWWCRQTGLSCVLKVLSFMFKYIGEMGGGALWVGVGGRGGHYQPWAVGRDSCMASSFSVAPLLEFSFHHPITFRLPASHPKPLYNKDASAWCRC